MVKDQTSININWLVIPFYLPIKGGKFCKDLLETPKIKSFILRFQGFARNSKVYWKLGWFQSFKEKALWGQNAHSRIHSQAYTHTCLHVCMCLYIRDQSFKFSSKSQPRTSILEFCIEWARKKHVCIQINVHMHIHIHRWMDGWNFGVYFRVLAGISNGAKRLALT